jgi:Na+/melibiose symporter-like transporter
MVSISAAVGPLFGGFMTTFLSWRWGFAVELIFVIFILVMQHKIPDFEPTESRSDLDITGAIISLIGLVLFVWGILMLTKDTSTSVIVIVLGLVILAAFALFERRRKSNGKVPLLDMDLFKDRNLRVGAIIRLIGCLAMGGALFAVSLFLQSVMQLNALNTGLTTLPMTIGLLIFAIAAPSLSTKFSHKTLIAVGSLIAIIGCVILSFQFRSNTTMYDLMPGLFVLGAGLGFVMSLSTDISLVNIPKKSENNASGVLTTTQTLGESMGTAIIGVILILGVMGGLGTAIDMYAPGHSNDAQFFDDAANYLQAAGTDNVTQDSTVMKAVDVVIQEAMGFVMIVTAILLAVVFIATLRLEPKKQ